MKYIVIQDFEWKSVVGREDAMNTALANGILWTLKGMILGSLSGKTRINKFVLLVKPDFSQKHLESQLHCIFRFRIVHIILITAYILMQKASQRLNRTSTKIETTVGGDLDGGTGR